MKFNKWTLGLAALGVVSLASVAKADEKMSSAALSSTTISGYVDTSAQWNFGDSGPLLPPYKFGGSGKADGFNLDVVQLTIAKPLDEGEWSAGYRADLWFGPDANTLGTSSVLGGNTSDFAIRQAYVNLRMPVGNGIDWKVGVFDTIVGYESVESGANPNYTRSYGHSIEPQTHTGILASYRFSDLISASVGVADEFGSQVDRRSNPPRAESFKTYMGSVALTAPSDWGWASGSTLYLGLVNGYNQAVLPSSITSAVGIPNFGAEETFFYAGLTMATPVTGLKVGAALDWLQIHGLPTDSNDLWVIGGYASYQATEKLSFHGRGEYGSLERPGKDFEFSELTGTVQYDLWKNVISRAEIRWDYSDTPVYGPGRDLRNQVMVAANIIYKF